MADQGELPSEAFKRAITATTRAIARDGELEVTFGANGPRMEDERVVLTPPSRDLTRQEIGEIRGEATFRLLAEALPERAGDLHMLAEVERVTAAYLSHYLLSPVSTEAEAACRASAKRRVTAMSIDSWAAFLEGERLIIKA